jgi:hypothetical protein
MKSFLISFLLRLIIGVILIALILVVCGQSSSLFDPEGRKLIIIFLKVVLGCAFFSAAAHALLKNDPSIGLWIEPLSIMVIAVSATFSYMRNSEIRIEGIFIGFCTIVAACLSGLIAIILFIRNYIHIKSGEKKE